MWPIQIKWIAFFALTLTACEEPSPTPETRGECIASVDPNDSVYACDGEELVWCVCDQYVDNKCPDQKGTWVVQDILCTCEEWLNGDCPIE